jgi:tetratricopeptide (TPR) repeat protein
MKRAGTVTAVPGAGLIMRSSIVLAAVLAAVLVMCSWSLGQSTGQPAAQTSPAGQAAPAAGQSANGQAAAPAGKRPPKVNSQEEFAAYKAASALTDAAAMEKASDDFAAKYPDSELRPLLYRTTMQRYQLANNGDKMLEMARKVLSIDPDDPEALVGVAQVLAERTRDTDLDRDQRLAESKKDAERALVTVETDIPTSGYPPEQLASYKGFLRSEAYAVLGKLSSDAKNWPEAEADLRKSIDAFPQQVDAIAVLRLAVALDMQNKVPEALKYADQAVDLTKDRPDSGAGKAARDEKDRLTKLNVGTAPGATPPKN